MRPPPLRLTVVVSTFNRPDALGAALRSLVRQTFREWSALVIGDQCDARTGEVVVAIGGSRLKYFNLPGRCGDQSGPNSIGAALSTSPYLAFLNHDDLLLPDHFARLLDRLDATGADLCFGRCLRVDLEPGGLEEESPRFVEAPMRRLSVLRCFPPPSAFAYEPVSAWVLRADAYRRVGAWTDGFDLHRPPFNDWLLRACRARLTTCVADRPTVVHPLTHNEFRGEGGVYGAPASVQQALCGRLEGTDPETFRILAARSGAKDRGRVARARVRWYARHFRSRPGLLAWAAFRRLTRPLLPALLAPLAWTYFLTGVDAYSAFCRMRGRRPGAWKTWVLTYRTGTHDLARADREALLGAARAALGDEA